MSTEKQDDDSAPGASHQESGAGYGNNALTDEVGQAGENEATMPNEADE